MLAERLRDRAALLALPALAFALPSAVLPQAPALLCAVTAWLGFVASFFVGGGRSRGFELATAAALAGLAVLDPPAWIGVGGSLLAARLLLAAPRSSRCAIALGVGVLAPALLYAALYTLVPEARNALTFAFYTNCSAFELMARGLALVALCASTVVCVSGSQVPTRFRMWTSLGAIPIVIVALRLAWIVSVATLHSDLLVWSEPPALVNLLKLARGERFYGPLEWANSYSYSPGLELTQYALLRPFRAELSLQAHRWLGIGWQLLAALVLTRVLTRRVEWSEAGARAKRWQLAALFAALCTVTMSSFLAPHVHPDHLLLLCFSFALALCAKEPAFQRRDWLWLVLIPVLAVSFKLTGAGIGLGLVFAALLDRNWRALAILALAALLSLFTIPLFDATLGEFSTYAIKLQASHPVEWRRALQVPTSTAGIVFGVAVGLTVILVLVGKNAELRPALRMLALSSGFGLISLPAYLKHGGRENSLMPWLIGGAVVLLELTRIAVKSEPSRAFGANAPLLAVAAWLALIAAWPIPPVSGEPRRTLVAVHERERTFLSESWARGQTVLSLGTAAWIEAGGREPPRDRLVSASELELAHWASVRGVEQRLRNGTYDALFLPAAVLLDNDLMRRLRGQLEQTYCVAEPAKLNERWPREPDGYVVLRRRGASGSCSRQNAKPLPP